MKLLVFICTILGACLLVTVVCSYAASEEDYFQQQPDKPWPNPRFSANDNGTVTDHLTGLIWLKNADCFGVRDRDTAVSLANTLANGQCGLIDSSKAGQWRLPTRSELNGLVNRKQFNSVRWLNQQGFSGVQEFFYWSSSSSEYSSDLAWYVDMRFGGTYKSNINIKYNVWPVRGGQ